MKRDVGAVTRAEAKGADRVLESPTTQTSSRSGSKPPRKKRSEQWIPVWAWLETLPIGQAKSLKSTEIEEWLQKNPEIAEDLLRQHSRKHLYHYIRKCFHTVRNRKDFAVELKAVPSPVGGGIETRRTKEAKQGKQIVVLSSSSNSSGAQEICGIGDSSFRFSDDVQTGRCEVSVGYNGGDGGDPGPSVHMCTLDAGEGEQKKAGDSEKEKEKDVEVEMEVLPVVSTDADGSEEEEEEEEEEAQEGGDERCPGSGKDQEEVEMTAVNDPAAVIESECQANDGDYGLMKEAGEGAKATELPLLDGAVELEDGVNLAMTRVHSGRSADGPALKGKRRTKRLKSKMFEEGTSTKKKDWFRAFLKGSRGEMSKHVHKQHAQKKSHISSQLPGGGNKVTRKEWVYRAVKNDAFSNGFAWEEKPTCGDPRPDDPEYRRFSQAKLDMVEELVWPLDGWIVRVRQRHDTKTYDAYTEHKHVQMRSAKEIQRYLERHPEWSRSNAPNPAALRSGRKSKLLAKEAATMKEGRTKDKQSAHARQKSDVEEIPDSQILWSKVHSEINRYNCLVALHIRLRQYLAEYQSMKRAMLHKRLEVRDSESAEVDPGLDQDTRSSVSAAMSGDEGYSRPAKVRKLGPWPTAEECYMRRDEVSSVPAVTRGEDDTLLQCVDGSTAGERATNRVHDEQPVMAVQRVEERRRSTRWLRMRVGGRRVPNLTAHASPPVPTTGRTDASKPLMTAWAVCKASADHEFGVHGAAALEDEPTPASGSRREKEIRGYAATTKDGRNSGVGAKGVGRDGGVGADALRNRKAHRGEHASSQRKVQYRALDLLFEREIGGSLGSWLQEVGRSKKRWTSLCQGWHTLGKPFAGPGVWAKRTSHKLLLPTWCAYTSSVATAPTAWGSAIELQPVQKVLDLRFHPGGAPQLVSGCSAAPNELLLYNLSTGRVNELAGHNCLVQAVEYVPNGDRIVSCGGNIVKVWDSATGECLHSMGPGSDGDEGPAGHVKNITALTVNSFQGNLVVSSGEAGDTRLLLWNISSGELISDLNASLRERNSVIPQVDALQFATPTILVCGSDSGQGMPAQVQLWDIEAQSEHVTIHAHDSYIMCLDVTSSGNMIVTGAGDGTTGLFDARTRRGIARIPLAQECEVTSVSFSPCGVYFQASCSANFSLVFDMRMMPLDPDPQWNPLGRPMIPASQAHRSLRPLHCLSHGKPMPTVQNAGQMPGFVDIGDQGVNDARWFHGSSRLATASGNGSVAVWDVSLGEPCVKIIASHSRSANAIAITPDDLIFASGGDDQKVVLYQDFKSPSRAPWRLSLPVMQPPSRELALDP